VIRREHPCSFQSFWVVSEVSRCYGGAGPAVRVRDHRLELIGESNALTVEADNR
jgi:hypothetical protein